MAKRMVWREAVRRAAWCGAWLLAGAARAAGPAGAPSEASVGLSALPVAMSVATPALLVSGTGVLLVKAVEVGAEGSAWVLERAADGSRFTLRLGTRAVVASGAVLLAVPTAGGWLLMEGPQPRAFVPGAGDAALFHHEQVSR